MEFKTGLYNLGRRKDLGVSHPGSRGIGAEHVEDIIVTIVSSEVHTKDATISPKEDERASVRDSHNELGGG